jgi:hypothetical protein
MPTPRLRYASLVSSRQQASVRLERCLARSLGLLPPRIKTRHTAETLARALARQQRWFDRHVTIC